MLWNMLNDLAEAMKALDGKKVSLHVIAFSELCEDNRLQSRPTLSCFVHFDFEMCFAPQRRALFRYRNFQKWSEPLVVLYILTWKCASRHKGVHFFDISTSKSGPDLVCFCTFWLGNVLRATTACNFSSLIWPAGSAPPALASLLFDSPEPQIIGKNTVFRVFPTFSRICIFFLLTLSLLIFSLLIFLFSLPLPCSAFHLSILWEVWLINFLRIV